MNYWFDENMPPSLVKAIAALHTENFPDDRVESVLDAQGEGRSDVDWITELMQGGEQWAVITRDAMRKERQLVQSSGLTWFILARGWASLDYWTLSWKLVKAWPDLAEASRRSPGQVFTVALNGKVSPARGLR